MVFRFSIFARPIRLLIIVVLGTMTWLSWSCIAVAGELSQRISDFPNWQHQPVLPQAEGDLAYPAWFVGTWQMTSILEDMVAPLAPDIVTPGFEGNRQFLHQPVSTSIRFVNDRAEKERFLGYPLTLKTQVVSDRAYNGLNLAQAYLGDDAVSSVKVDPNNPNRQITVLKDGQQLISTVTRRATEAPTANDFLTTELFQQFFRGE
ncbi:MAG: hypothetical protein F6K09_18195, partial [Merismopedia sp. SIO2A8]|nr:hypothetical protein [Merismopedia sp. SIO2A8]